MTVLASQSPSGDAAAVGPPDRHRRSPGDGGVRRPPLVAAVGLVRASLETGYGLSPLIERRLPTLLATALTTLAGWGVPVDSLVKGA